MNEERATTSTFTAVCLVLVVSALVITAIIVLWKYIFFAIIFFGLLPILRIFFGGASFFAKH